MNSKKFVITLTSKELDCLFHSVGMCILAEPLIPRKKGDKTMSLLVSIKDKLAEAKKPC